MLMYEECGGLFVDWVELGGRVLDGWMEWGGWCVYRLTGWMDEWMDGWMDGWMNGWMDDREIHDDYSE